MSYQVDYTKGNENPYFDEKLVTYRKNRPAKTSGNPYIVLGEPIGDLRDNMTCKNIDLCQNIIAKELKINDIKVRVYQTNQKDDRACIFFIHGGAFIGGDLETVENPCKYIAKHGNALVISVDYRLAPEVGFPDNANDCKDVIESVLEDESYHFDRSRVYISGDSAGANLSLYCAQTIKHNFKGLLLYYPVLDMSGVQEYWKWDESTYRGYPNELVKNCSTSLKDSEFMMQKLYLQEYKNYRDPLVSPLYIKDASILPPLLIQYAEYDYLCLQIESFIKRLEKDKHEVTSYCFNGMNHAFLNLLGIVDQAKISLDILCSYIKGEKYEF